MGRHVASSRSGDGTGGSAVRALAAAGSIELGLHVGWSEVDVAGGGVDVGVAQQGLHHGQIHAALSVRVR